MKYTKFLLITLILSQAFMSCETVDFEDTNQNNNGPSDPYPSGLLAGAIMSFATTTGRTGLMQPTLYVQYQSQVTYVDEMLYSEVPVSWYTYYVNVMNPLEVVIDVNSDEANHTATLLSQGAPENQIGVAMIFQAVAMNRVTNTWGDAPFSGAFEGTENLSPTYDSQEDIYKALFDQVKAGRDMLDESKAGPTGDIIYYGDVLAWKKFANSFLLQLAITLTEVYPEASGLAATEFNAALNHPAGVIDELSEEAYFSYEDVTGFRNPWNANRTPDYFLSKEFTDALKGNAELNPTSNRTFDERIYVYATSTDDGVPYGFADGSGAGASSVSNDYYWNNTSPLPLLTASYTYLNRAEAAAIGWTSEDETEMLRQGIEMSFETLADKSGEEIADDGEAYADARLNDVQSVPGGILQIIGEEKWKALFGQAFIAWTEWRRTGYPDLEPAEDAVNSGEIPTRYLYPIEEQALNKEAYESAVGRLSTGRDEGTARFWWDVD